MVLAVALGATAQTTRAGITTRGTGSFQLGFQTKQSVRRIQVNLNRDYRFQLRVTADKTLLLEGRWEEGRDRNNTFNLYIESGFDKDGAQGNGVVVLNRTTVERVDLNGKTKGQKFTIEFDSANSSSGSGSGSGSGSDNSNSGKFNQFSKSKSGKGTVKVQTQNDKSLNRVEIALYRSGSFDLGFSGDSRFRVKGKWQWSGNDIRLEIKDALGDGRAMGSGTVYINRQGNDVWKIDLSGMANNRKFSVSFRE